jgi:peroxiredoxin
MEPDFGLVTAPDFSLQTFEGQPFILSTFCARKHVVLVFNRGFL